MLVWIIDEEWTDYDLENEYLPKVFENVDIRISNYNYEEDLKEFGYKADAILAQVYAEIPRSTIENLENCKVISTYGGGYDRIDLDACKEKGIRVTNIQGYCAEDLADYTLAAIYHFNKKIQYYANTCLENVKAGKWGSLVIEKPTHRLSEENLVIVGFGAIGKAIADKVKGTGINIYAVDEFLSETEIEKYGVKKLDWEEGFKMADYISVNLKGIDANKNKISMNEFKLMKNTASIINTSRGKVINESDLIEAVRSKEIAGAIVDVITNEPPNGDEEIFLEKNILVTPHISYISIESMKALKEFALGNLEAVLKGEEPRDPVI
ncbi:C-terminal binding protein [Peptoniphilus genitalis]|uniref:C-terminal binding protein n=1 Tax=Peptoniphilus genitalis TaxID=3036303 RepID=A0ABY4TNP0_9FIRM|nr:C-terminal binding protein [Peptoniphilus sp. SAHP1]URN42083.1 C-terminal binding protein [Peptoniphilus sp. SAHP1]